MTLVLTGHRSPRTQGEGRLRPCRRPCRERPHLRGAHGQRRRRCLRRAKSTCSRFPICPASPVRLVSDEAQPHLLVEPGREHGRYPRLPGPDPDGDARSRSASDPTVSPTITAASSCSPPMSAIRRSRVRIRVTMIDTRRHARCSAADRRAAAARAGRCSMPMPRVFYVNIADPAVIVGHRCHGSPIGIAHMFAVPRGRTARPRSRPGDGGGCSAPAMPASRSPWMPCSGKIPARSRSAARPT